MLHVCITSKDVRNFIVLHTSHIQYAKYEICVKQNTSVAATTRKFAYRLQ